MDEDDDAELGSYAPVRPYSAECDAAGGRRHREGRRFRPTLPTERRSVEQALFSSTAAEETVQSLLWEASRRQDASSAARSRETAMPERFQGMALRKFGIGPAGAAAGAAAFASRGGGVAAPRRVKELKADRSMELMDLAFTSARRTVDGQIRETYAPISLPYYNSVAEEDGALHSAGPCEGPGAGPGPGHGGGAGKRKGRPALLRVDEANANAARELLLSADGELQEEVYILMQLPSVLPELLDPLEEVQREQEDAASAGVGAGITRLPDGLLGKLRIHKSGKVRMEFGGLPFCVDQGSDTFFRQDLACVCPLANEVIDLGPIRKRMVLTPDVDALLDELFESPPDAAAAAAAGASRP
uniref:DNA-directed RNA polymerase III subunit RPC4 n=1 Tax=Alexandrium monilatum TaxID=311494 RepID=A0A7S4Q699_9DINO